MRRGGQETRQYELPGRNASMGGIVGDGSQGMHNEPIFSNKISDFGQGYKQFSKANQPPQKQAQLLLPTGIPGNF